MLNETEPIPILATPQSAELEVERGPSHVNRGRIARLFFMAIVGLLLGYVFWRVTPGILMSLWNLTGHKQQGQYQDQPISNLASSMLGFLLGTFIAHTFLNTLSRMVGRWDDMDSGDKVTLFLGIFIGLVGSIPFLFLLTSLFSGQYLLLMMSMLGVTLAVTGITVYLLQSMDDILPWNKTRSSGRRRHIKVLDTNVVIDGRVYDLVRTGFLEGQLYVPGFVLEELQYIADSHDALRRQRGRRGLDVLRLLQADFQLDVRTHDKLAPDMGDDVDNRLVRLARAMGADIVTNDFNLNRVAALQNVKVMNINDLALALRPNVLPQEMLTVSLVREGNQPGQGVGYLEDGTMVVVENGKAYMGETHEVVVTQVIQTERGKMIFAEMDDNEETQRKHVPRKH